MVYLPSDSDNDNNQWWGRLRHGGLLLSPVVLGEYLPEGPADLKTDKYDKLRDSLTIFEANHNAREKGDNSSLFRWLDSIFEGLLEYQAPLWLKETEVTDRFKAQSVTGERLRPNRVLLHLRDMNKPRFLVKIDTDNDRIGMGRGRTEYSKFITLLRGTKVPFGILTNGYQFRLVYAGMDHDSWTEWDATQWFDEGGEALVAGFIELLGRRATTPDEKEDYPLLQRVLESRTRQGELSQVLGEQVREAVEMFLSNIDKSLRANPDILKSFLKKPDSDEEIPENEKMEALYQASIRVIMRLVVCLFAESRELLPRSMEAYNSSYGVEGLYRLLDSAYQAEGETNLRDSRSAWPRLLSLFRLIHDGSPYEDIPVPAYDGELFRPGDQKSRNNIHRALSIFEDETVSLDDYVVLQILRLLKIGKFRARRGRSSTWVSGPVDFSDLRTEYIGMMYEGLLDYTLKQVKKEEEAVVFLNLGIQPALPLSLLKNLDEKELKNLIETLKKEKTTGPKAEEGEGEKEGAEEEEAIQDEEQDEAALEEPTGLFTADETARKKSLEWASQAVEVAGLIKKPKGKTTDQSAFENEKNSAAERMVLRILGPGEMYLVRWSGTRKGSGTFYTKPQLAVPTVHRTLEDLVYTRGEDGVLVPKPPEVILNLKACDTSMGSASFLVAALRYLTDALYESLVYYKRIRDTSDKTAIVTVLPMGIESKGGLEEELQGVPSGDERFEFMLKARLKRHIVERCIYGVDINPLAVELAKLALWVETMDRELPFTFLDHKLKVGNSLVGAWLDTFMEYPALAWMREGGDKNHSNGVHYKKEEWTKAIKAVFNDRVKPELVELIEKRAGQKSLQFFHGEENSVPKIQEHARMVFEEIHKLSIKGRGVEQREDCYNKKLRGNVEYQRLREALDLWCSVWFWPADKFEVAPTPKNFYAPSEETRRISMELAEKLKFFHWELEFPDVFNQNRHGFDTIMGNPPWEISKPNSMEFFIVIDPIYRTHGKQDAIQLQKKLFERDKEIEHSWLLYNANFKSMSNYAKNSAYPFGDPDFKDAYKLVLKHGKDNDSIHRLWKNQRAKHTCYSDSAHPYRNLGSADLNTYKMFLEIGHMLLCNGGHLGMIVPSGIYTDQGSTELRKLFLERCQWAWLFGFENKKGIFNIHKSSKFCPIVIVKRGKTSEIKTAFMRHDLADWETPEKYIMLYKYDQAGRFSPNTKSLLEIRSQRDLEILEKIYKNSVLLGDTSEKSWKIQYDREFDMTNDSKLFSTITKRLEQGYKPDLYGRWIGLNSDITLPLYEGRMIGQFDFSKKGWVSGKGRSAVWRDIPFEDKKIEPQYLMNKSVYYKSKSTHDLKVAYMRISSATNSRSMISCCVWDYPCEVNASLLLPKDESVASRLILVANLNSFVFDFVLRTRFGGTTLNWFIVEECSMLDSKSLKSELVAKIVALTAKLCFIHPVFSIEWLRARYEIKQQHELEFYWAITPHERLRLRCILDAIVAELYGLSYEDFEYILRDDPSDPKGFWRVDKEKPKELRHTTLALLAFKHLKEVGLEKFCNEDWQFPADIQEKLGSRFLPWQLEGTPEESWKECEMHARNILGEEGFKNYMRDIDKKEVKQDKVEFQDKRPRKTTLSEWNE